MIIATKYPTVKGSAQFGVNSAETRRKAQKGARIDSWPEGGILKESGVRAEPDGISFGGWSVACCGRQIHG